MRNFSNIEFECISNAYSGGAGDVSKYVVKVLRDKGYVYRHWYWRKINNKNIIVEENNSGKTTFHTLVMPKFLNIGSFRQIILNHFVSKHLSENSIVLCLSNSSFGLKKCDALYIHHSLYSAYKDYAHYSLIKKPYRFIMGQLWKLLESKEKATLLLFNSEYTKRIYISTYINAAKKDNLILYPPVYVNFKKQNINKIKNLVVSVGRISPEKRQLEQINIAAQLPQYHFVIIGFADEKDKYYQEVLKKSKEHGNVTLKVNIPQDDVFEILYKAKYFLHTMQKEHFGIAIVQAILCGCYPIVNKSGGPIEIVEKNGLLYSNYQEVIDFLKGELIHPTDTFNIIRKSEDYISKFSVKRFEEQFFCVLEKICSTSVRT